jgi:hypothetical protein
LVTVSHGALAVAVHVHEAADALTAIEPEPPRLWKSCEIGVITIMHAGGGGGGGGGADWDTVNV